ncbi:efflux RND transporter periplasmic adaptor subunit [Sphingomonas solaris]|uniref:Efflux RND transporter periplasmic adaptor subunit n=1 Tax=Alterirhizorhabdus solaris TaxID=2529389 RepID=A0A558R7V3_9SPHN|nr:efflux RND transporter periplasmic adaptor subunit [Sphingomonas solaris]TVV75473.1 efflux RND transporter periplasmic adaptor subunit [Sphingomonas solaris]
MSRLICAATLALLLAGCGGTKPATEAGHEEAGHKEDGHEEGGHEAGGEAGHAETPAGSIAITPEQITAAGIVLIQPTLGGASGAIRVSANVQGDPQGMRVVSAAIGGRVVALTRNLGESVGAGQTLAILESREAATLNAETEAAAARAGLAQATLRREQRLFAARVSPERDLIEARTAATEANIALRLARQQRAAAGGGRSAGGLNRIAIVSPIAGQVIARNALLGQTVAADAELFRVANLSTVSLSLALTAADAGRVRPGARVEVTAPGRTGTARVRFVSPVLDETSRMVPVIATLPNPAGQWRVGEMVTAAVLIEGGPGPSTIAVPTTAVQSVEDAPTVFVRTATGFRAVPVKLGARNGNMVAITQGLAGRETIAAANSFTLKAELGKAGASHEH